MTKRRRLRDEQVLIDRDLDMLIKLHQGRTKRNIACAHRISVRHLNERIHDIPPEVKDRVYCLVDRYASTGSQFVPDAELDGIRRAMRRGRRGKSVLARLQAARMG